MIRFVHVLALVAGLLPFGAFAQQALPTDQEGRTPLEYSAPIPPDNTDKPLIPSFQRRSGTAAGGPANELNTGDSRAREKMPGGNVLDAVTGRDLYHGNFCGHGNRGDQLAAADELDAVCKRHDECFERTNRACSCNETLRREAFRVAELKSASRELRARAASVVEAAPVIECRRP